MRKLNKSNKKIFRYCVECPTFGYQTYSSTNLKRNAWHQFIEHAGTLFYSEDEYYQKVKHLKKLGYKVVKISIRKARKGER